MSSIQEGICHARTEVHMAQVVSMTKDVIADLFICTENESCLTEIRVESYLQ